MFVARESLLAGKTAQVLLRPQLFLQWDTDSNRLHHTPCDVSELEDATLEIVCRDRNGQTARKSVKNLSLSMVLALPSFLSSLCSFSLLSLSLFCYCLLFFALFSFLLCLLVSLTLPSFLSHFSFLFSFLSSFFSSLFAFSSLSSLLPFVYCLLLYSPTSCPFSSLILFRSSPSVLALMS